MFQDSVPAGSYNDPFLSSVCVCVFWNPLTLSIRSEGEALARVVMRPNATTIWTSG